MRKVFIIDFDYTLSDTSKVKADITDTLTSKIGKEITKHFWEYYEKTKKQNGRIDFPQTLIDFIDLNKKEIISTTAIDIFKSLPFDMHLHSGVKDAFKSLQKQGDIYIYSEGEPNYQLEKVRKSGLDIYTKEVFCFTDKLKNLPTLFNTFKDYKIIYVEDKVKYLIEAEKLNPNIITVFVNQGEYAQNADDQDIKQIDYSIKTFSEINRLTFD